MTTTQHLVSQAFTGLLALALVGITGALLIMGRPVPEFLVGFDGVIVTAAFANGAFFVQARALSLIGAGAQDLRDKYHALAGLAIHSAAGTKNGTAETTGGERT